MNIIETHNLTKQFGNTTAVDNVSIHVKEGEIYGFLGLNGAGKTTAIRMLLGMISPNNGSANLFGKEVNTKFNVWNEVGYLVETTYSYPELSVKENLEIYFRLRKLHDKNRISKIIEKLQLTKYQNKKAKHLSLGNLQRLGIAKALMHEPKLLILDEPTNGLDPEGIVEIRELFKDLVNRGSTIFISSHILNEISKIAHRIGIIHEGKLIRELNTHELDEQIIRKLLINTNDNNKAISVLKDAGHLAVINPENIIELTDRAAILFPENITIFLVNANLPPKQLNVIAEDLEMYFLRIVRKNNER